MKLTKWGRTTISTALACTCIYASAYAKELDVIASGYEHLVGLTPTIVGESRTLLLSDSPEYVGPTGGILSAGTVDGAGRIYFYHVNDMKTNQKMGIVLENKTDRRTKVTVERSLVVKPSPDYFEVGRNVSKEELEPSKGTDTITLQPYSRHVIMPELDKVTVRPQDLVSGIVDFHSNGPVYAKVMMLREGRGTLGASYLTKVLPMDHVALRGTFSGADRTITVSTYDSTQGAYVELANNREDPFLKGRDSLSNEQAVEDTGNYGVTYTVTIPTTGTMPFRLYFNPLGGAYSGSFEVTTVKGTHQHTRVYDVGKPHIGDGTIHSAAPLGKYKGGDTLIIRFMPAGASNLPIRFLLLPESTIVER